MGGHGILLPLGFGMDGDGWDGNGWERALYRYIERGFYGLCMVYNRTMVVMEIGCFFFYIYLSEAVVRHHVVKIPLAHFLRASGNHKCGFSRFAVFIAVPSHLPLLSDIRTFQIDKHLRTHTRRLLHSLMLRLLAASYGEQPPRC